MIGNHVIGQNAANWTHEVVEVGIAVIIRAIMVRPKTEIQSSINFRALAK
jgi:uncharacterized membrane protein (DUF373 family)